MTQRMIALAPGVEPPPCPLGELISRPMTLLQLQKSVGELERAGYHVEPILSGIGTIDGYIVEGTACAE